MQSRSDLTNANFSVGEYAILYFAHGLHIQWIFNAKFYILYMFWFLPKSYTSYLICSGPFPNSMTFPLPPETKLLSLLGFTSIYVLSGAVLLQVQADSYCLIYYSGSGQDSNILSPPHDLLKRYPELCHNLTLGWLSGDGGVIGLLPGPARKEFWSLRGFTERHCQKGWHRVGVVPPGWLFEEGAFHWPLA